MGTITMRLPALDLGVIQAAVDARVIQSHRSDPHDLHPPAGRQRAAALVDLLRGEDAGTAAKAKVTRSAARRTPAARASTGCTATRRAIDHLRPWELPWLKPGLEPVQQGIPWTERYLLLRDDVHDLISVPEGITGVVGPDDCEECRQELAATLER